MQVTAAMVKELRQRSAAGMMECKKALVESAGDIEAAFDHLRKTGAAKAAKKAGRVAAEGAIAARVADGVAVIVEVNSETDFAAKDDNFVGFLNAVVDTIHATRPQSLEALNDVPLGGGESVENARRQLVAKIGENISVRRFGLLNFGSRTGASYLHGTRIGVLVDMEGGDPDLARDIAMHVAASAPLCVDEAAVPVELLEKEREIQIAQAEQSGKPPEIVEKMVTGRLRKFVAEMTLLGQPFVKDPDKSVAQLLQENGATVRSFLRYEVGEGIDKKDENFAEEVMAQARSASQGAS
jgi:elongation factor Ts